MLGASQVGLGDDLLEIDRRRRPAPLERAGSALSRRCPAFARLHRRQRRGAGPRDGVIGGRMEGRPLAPARVDRDRPAAVLAGVRRAGRWSTFLTLVIATIVHHRSWSSALLDVGPIELIDVGDQPARGAAASRCRSSTCRPGIVLGEVGVVEAISRSFRLVRLRKRLASSSPCSASCAQFMVGVRPRRPASTSSSALVGGPDGLELVPAAARGPGHGRDPVVRARHARVPRRGDRRVARGARVRVADALHARPRGRARRTPGRRAPTVGRRG